MPLRLDQITEWLVVGKIKGNTVALKPKTLDEVVTACREFDSLNGVAEITISAHVPLYHGWAIARILVTQEIQRDKRAASAIRDFIWAQILEFIQMGREEIGLK